MRIKERYHQVTSGYSSHDGLDDAFSMLSLEAKSCSETREKISPKNVIADRMSSELNPMSNDVTIVLMAMRKIREAIVASSRIDSFASQAYRFIIRATIPLKHMESYHPALLHLLHKIQPLMPLANSEYHEFLGYHILDLACRQDNLAAAYQAKCQYKYRDAKIETVLKALAHGNWYTFWALRTVVSRREASLMEWAENRMRTHALKCLGKAYLTLDRAYLQQSVQQEWEKLEEKDGLGWQVNGDVVQIRKISRK